MSELILSQIFIYPIKSLRGISLQQTQLTGKGPKWDRRWMLVDADGRFLSQRERGRMALLQPYLEADHLRISDLRGGRSDLTIPFEIEEKGMRTSVLIWQDQCEAISVSKAADQWFSEALDLDCHLVYMPDDSSRPVDPKYARGKETVSFADGYPYLIIGEASMVDLNARLERPIEMIRFRPNLVFSGGTPFMEDHWKYFSIGQSRFRGTKPCARCQVPTIDLTTGESSPEPTRTLAGFRRKKNNILFGLNACWEGDREQSGRKIKVGDQLEYT